MTESQRRPTLSSLEKIMKLMDKYKIDELEFDGIKIHKKIHMGPKLPKKPFSLPPKSTRNFEEDVMYASTSAPKLSIEAFNRFAANPVNDFDCNASRLKD